MYLVSAQAAAGTWLVELILMAILCLNGAVAQTPYILLHLKIALARHYNRFERTGIFADSGIVKRWALGCVNSPLPRPERARRRDSRNLWPT